MPRAKISFVGNCQTMSLSKFARELPDKHESYWLCFEPEWKSAAWTRSVSLWGETQLQYNIFDNNISIKTLIQSDIVVYQPNFIHNDIIKKVCGDQTLHITLSPVFVNNLNYMRNKENKYMTSIKISDIITQNSNNLLYINNDNHLTTFLSLEILKQICLIANIEFFDASTYKQLLLSQYPAY